MDLRLAYEERFPVFEKVAGEIRALLEDLFRGAPHIDRISARVKATASFVKKASSIDPISGIAKYNYPLEEIQDQIGVRIVVFYRSDVELMAQRILTEIREVEDRIIEQPDPESFAYEARHFVCFIPLDIYVAQKPPIDFFELQISTLFQHAWAEANHDLGYKPDKPLSYDHRRRVAWAAAQAWGADQIFDELRRSREQQC